MDYRRERRRFMMFRTHLGRRTIDCTREWWRFIRKTLIIREGGDDSRYIGHCGEVWPIKVHKITTNWLIFEYNWPQNSAEFNLFCPTSTSLRHIRPNLVAILSSGACIFTIWHRENNVFHRTATFVDFDATLERNSCFQWSGGPIWPSISYFLYKIDF